MHWCRVHDEKNKYGDCKALSYFMKSILEEVKIEATPALIKRGGVPQNFHAAFH